VLRTGDVHPAPRARRGSNAHSIGAVFDAAQWPEVLGTVAGDDTIFVLIKDIRLGAKVLKKIQEYSE